MPAEQNGMGKLLITGVISLIVGVASGLLLDFFKTKAPRLDYRTVTTSVFSGPSENIAILTIETENSGKKELEDLTFSVNWKDAELRESKVSGLPIGKYKEKPDKTSFTIESDYLNPTEKIRADLLLTLAGDSLKPPRIDIRAKGIVGRERDDTASEKTSTLSSIVTAALTALLSAFFVMPNLAAKIRAIRNKGYTASHSDDQRDVTAYVLDVHGLHKEAADLRRVSRKMSYWSIADDLTQGFLDAGDNDRLKQLAEVLEELMSYGAVAETSCFLVNYNLARIHLELGNRDLARAKLDEALKDNHKVIGKRIQLIPDLNKLRSSEGEKTKGG